MIPYIISQRVTRWEKPDSNPYHWLLGAPAKLLFSTQLFSPSCPLIQPLPSSPSFPSHLSRPGKLNSICSLRLLDTQRHLSEFYPQDYMAESHCQIYQIKLLLGFIKENQGVLKLCLCISFSLKPDYARALQGMCQCLSWGIPSCSGPSSFAGHNVVG